MRKAMLRSAGVLLISWSLYPMSIQAKPVEAEPSPIVAEHSHSLHAAGPVKIRVQESYPSRIQARLEQRRRTLKTAFSAPTSGFSPHFILNLTKRWQVGQTLKVAFRGGNTALHKQIADNVTQWTQFANLKFDFGINHANGKYRTWTTSDTVFAADIRVSFDQTGFFSLVGNDSLNLAVTKTGEESLNLQGFDQQLPSDWKAVSLHEFGHAIGFEHEHQAPLAPCDFRFNDDAGYIPSTDEFGQFIADSQGRQPGLYTVLGGPPNNWPQAVVDFNLKPMADSSAFELGPFDKLSIMKYFFPDWMFVSGSHSECFTDSETLVLSEGDKKGAAKVYPKTAADIKVVTDRTTKVLQEITTKLEKLPDATKKHFEQQLRYFDQK